MTASKLAQRSFLIFSLLLACQICLLRLAFYLGYGNRLYILHCFAVALGILLSSAAAKKYGQSDAQLKRLSGTVLAPSALLLFPLAFSQGGLYMAISCVVMLLLSAAINLALHRGAPVWEQKRVGMLFGAMFALSDLAVYVLFYSPLSAAGALLPLIVICALLLAALALNSTSSENAMPAVPQPEQKPKFLWLFFAALLLGSVICGLVDSMYYINPLFQRIPAYRLFLYVFSIALDLLAGLLFSKGGWRVSFTACVLLICAGQALSFFGSSAQIALPYTALTLLGTLPMELFIVAAPAYYVLSVRKQAGIAGAGLAALYLGFGLTSAFYEFYSSESYVPILGAVLMLSLPLIGLLHYLFNLTNELRTATLVDALRKEQAGQTSIERMLEGLKLSPREKEVCARLLAGHSLKQIAYDLKISYSTVSFHCNSLYRKLDINSRAELYSKIAGT